MIVIVGLGNPDKQYEQTYHNMGYMCVDAFADHYSMQFTKKKYNAYYAEAMLQGEKVILLKPTTYMNLSGVCVAECVRKLKLDLSKLLVVYDDIDLPFGTLRLRKNGSAGTHNGMRNIVENLASTEFSRLRIGIGRDESKQLKDYVLSKMSKQDKENFDSIKAKIVNVMHAFVATGGDTERIDVNNY